MRSGKYWGRSRHHVSDPRAPIVQIFTYFPLSAPVTAMLRNGFGTLSPLEAAS